MLDLEVIDDPESAALALDPIKRRLLAELVTPASAATLAGRVGLTRQKVNYHLRALENCKLVEPAEQRRWGGLTERLMVATPHPRSSPQPPSDRSGRIRRVMPTGCRQATSSP
jgi:DNA-binding transcriptional ArsR family regulator